MPDLTKTAVGEIVHAEIEKLREEQAARDAAQDARFARPSRVVAAVDAVDDFDPTKKYPIPSTVLGIAGIVAAFMKLQGVPLYLALAISLLFVPGMAMKAVRFASGLKKAKDGA